MGGPSLGFNVHWLVCLEKKAIWDSLRGLGASSIVRPGLVDDRLQTKVVVQVFVKKFFIECVIAETNWVHSGMPGLMMNIILGYQDIETGHFTKSIHHCVLRLVRFLVNLLEDYDIMNKIVEKFFPLFIQVVVWIVYWLITVLFSSSDSDWMICWYQHKATLDKRFQEFHSFINICLPELRMTLLTLSLLSLACMFYERHGES